MKFEDIRDVLARRDEETARVEKRAWRRRKLDEGCHTAWTLTALMREARGARLDDSALWGDIYRAHRRLIEALFDAAPPDPEIEEEP